jgi:CDP-glucose 4,6-dehydratase
MVKAVADKKITEIRNPGAVRPWQHVLDCLYGYLMLGAKLLDEEVEFAEAWNFAPYSFESKTVKEVAEISKSIWNDISIQYGNSFGNPHEANLLKLDNTKALTRLEWKPLWNTNQAISKTIEWYKSYYLTNNLLTGQQIEEYCTLNGLR